MQKILKGYQHIADCLKESGSRKYLLVCDASFQFLAIKDYFDSLNIPCVKFDQFTPNPLYEDVCKGVKLFREEGCDAIVAIGGGSTLDVAKCIKLYSRMSNDRLFLEQEYKDTHIPYIAIPTTAGTGSESTRYAVIYYDGKKQSVTHESIIPNYAILEPILLRTLPLYQKKCTMLDALCQGIESWWSVNSTDESKEYSKIAVETIMHYWREYIFNNTDKSCEMIMDAANFAGRAICITQTTAPHAFSYKITSLYKLPHGHAVAVCLPEIWQYMLDYLAKCIDARGHKYLEEIFAGIAKSMGCESPVEAIALFRQIMQEMRMGNPVSDNRTDDLTILSSSVNPIRLKNNPIELDAHAITGIYEVVVK